MGNAELMDHTIDETRQAAMLAGGGLETPEDIALDTESSVSGQIAETDEGVAGLTTELGPATAAGIGHAVTEMASSGPPHHR